MSRVGKKPIPVQPGIKVTIEGRKVTAKGPLGELTVVLHPDMVVRQDDGFLRVESRIDAGDRLGKALHGVNRAMLANAVEGVSKGFQKTLEIVGTGWRAALAGKNLEISLGYAQPVRVPIPEGLSATTAEKPPRISIKGMRKDQVGQFAADLRALRPPEPYLGKGIKYENEQIRRKAGKSAG